MAITLPISFTLTPLSTGVPQSSDDFSQALIANVQASISGGFMTGQIGGAKPITNIGPWFDGTFWWAWNTSISAYVPIVTYASYTGAVINGAMNIWQRNITFPAISSGYTADKYLALSTMATGVATVSRRVLNQTGSSLYPRVEYSLRITVTTAEASPGAGEYFIIRQSIERAIALPLFDQPTSFSILLKASVPGTYCVSIQNIDNSESYVMECNIISANVAQYFQFPNITQFPAVIGSWGTADTDAAYSISVSAFAGGTFQTTPNTWSASNSLATSNQSNLFATNGNTLDISLIQHESGPACTPFVPTSFDVDFLRCQRYYFKTYPYATYAGQAVSGGRYILKNITTSVADWHLFYPVPLLRTPVFVTDLNIYNPQASSVASRVYDAGTSTAVAVSGCITDSRSISRIISAATFSAPPNIILAHLTVDVDY